MKLEEHMNLLQRELSQALSDCDVEQFRRQRITIRKRNDETRYREFIIQWFSLFNNTPSYCLSASGLSFDIISRQRLCRMIFASSSCILQSRFKQTFFRCHLVLIPGFTVSSLFHCLLDFSLQKELVATDDSWGNGTVRLVPGSCRCLRFHCALIRVQARCAFFLLSVAPFRALSVIERMSGC